MIKKLLPSLVFLFYFSFQTFSQSEKKEQNIFYEIFIRSFADSNGDGIGDFKGATAKLDYLKQLGITGVWLMPVSPSPTYHKYDVTDYMGIDKDYGTMADFKTFLKGAHARNIKVVIDFVVNHCSSEHPWFLEAKKDKGNKFRNYFVWDDSTHITFEPHNWHRITDSNGNIVSKEKYYGFFWSGMPDLNFDNQKVRNEVLKIATYWVKEIGVDGLRVDAAQHVYFEHEKNHQWWKQFHDSISKINPNIIIVGEVYNNTEVVKGYLQNGLTSCFNFDLGQAIVRAVKNESAIGFLDTILLSFHLFENNSSITNATFITNHDQDRIMSEVKGSINKAKMAASILLTLPGSPYIYYGEEIGMLGAKPDPNIREPFLWNQKQIDKIRTNWIDAQFSTDETIVPLNLQLVDKSSIYYHYANWIALRENNPLLQTGKISAVNLSDTKLLAYKLSDDKNSITVIHNVSSQKAFIAEKEFTITNNFIHGSDAVKKENGMWEVSEFSTVIFKAP
jgi:alpha-amylase